MRYFSPPDRPVGLMDDILAQGMPGGGPQLTPQANPMPTPQAAPTPDVGRPSLWQRIQMRAQQLPSMLMPQNGISSLLNDDELGQARHQGLLNMGLSLLSNSQGVNGGNAPGFGPALAQGIQAGQQGFQNYSQQAVQGAMTAQEIAQQQRVLRNRAMIAQQYGPQPGDSESTSYAKRNGALTSMMMNGDFEGLKAAGSLPGEFFKSPYAQMMEHYKEPTKIETATDVLMLDPFTHQVIAKFPKGVSPETLAQHEFNRTMATTNADTRQREFDTRDAETLAGRFDKSNTGLEGSATSIRNAINAISQARAGNPAALKTAIIAFAGAADPKVQLRQGTLQFLKQIDPSFTGNIAATMSRLGSGTLPTKQLDSMEKLLRSLYADNRDEYDRRRTSMLQRITSNPMLSAYLSPTDEMFGDLPGGGAAAPASGANRVRSALGKP